MLCSKSAHDMGDMLISGPTAGSGAPTGTGSGPDASQSPQKPNSMSSLHITRRLEHRAPCLSCSHFRCNICDHNSATSSG